MPFPVDITMVKETEGRLGVAFPVTFVDRMMRSNGGEVVIEDEEWSLHSFFDTTAATRIKRTCNDIVRETTDAREWKTFPSGGVAIASNGMGDQLVFLPDPHRATQLQPTVFMWSHETGELDVVAKDFGDLE